VHAYQAEGIDMLVTSRRAGEALLIGDEIEIVIVHVGQTRVKVGILAPRKYRVTAGEIASTENSREFSSSFRDPRRREH